MIHKLKRYFSRSNGAIARKARAECLQIVDDAIEECDAIECWNFTAKRIRNKIAALDGGKKGRD